MRGKLEVKEKESKFIAVITDIEIRNVYILM